MKKNSSLTTRDLSRLAFVANVIVFGTTKEVKVYIRKCIKESESKDLKKILREILKIGPCSLPKAKQIVKEYKSSKKEWKQSLAEVLGWAVNEYKSKT